MSLRMTTGHCVECKRAANHRAEAKRRQLRTKDPKYRAYQRAYQRPANRKKRANDREWAKSKDRKNTAYEKKRRAEDPTYRARRRLRVRLGNAIRKYALGGKVHSSNEYGVDYDAIVTHLGPCPGNPDEWQIDHIRPLCSFDLDDHDQVREAFAPENHQWLPKRANLSKGGTYNGEHANGGL